MSSKKHIKFGLIGYPLTHSFSKKYFSQKFDNEGLTEYSFHLFPLTKGEYFPILKQINPNLNGLNVTIPYKEKVLPLLDELSEEAAAIGAVNCINFIDGKTIGYNTDAYGFEISLRNFLKPGLTRTENPNLKALVMGTGGASKAIKYVLKKMGIDFLMVSRQKEKGDLTYEEIDEKIVTKYRLIVNTTPLGTFPKADACPDIPYRFLTKQHYLYDLVYNPEESLFLRKGKNREAKVKNGLEMLYLQAEKSWEIWKN